MNFGNMKGQALVELALSLFLLFLIVFGTTEFGRAMFITNALNNAARDGARRAVVMKPLNIASLRTSIQESIPVEYNPADLNITILPTSPPSGDPVTVTVTLPFRPLTPFMDRFFPPGFRLSGEATMRYEG